MSDRHPRDVICPGDGKVACGHRRTLHSSVGCTNCKCTNTYMQLGGR